MKRKQADLLGNPANKSNDAKRKQKRSSNLTKNYQGFRIPDADWVIDKVNIKQISPEGFFHDYVLPRKPCILTNVTEDADFQKFTKWSNEYLRQRAGDAILQIERRKNEKSSFGEEAPRQPMSFASLIDHIEQDSCLHYLTSQTEDYEGSDLPALLAQPLTQLVDDLTVRPRLAAGLVPYQLNVWMGNTSDGSTSGLHHDFHDNLYVLLRGAKRFNVFSPVDADKLSMRGQVSGVHSNGLVLYKHSEGLQEDGVPLFAYRQHLKDTQRRCEMLINVAQAELNKREVGERIVAEESSSAGVGTGTSTSAGEDGDMVALLKEMDVSVLSSAVLQARVRALEGLLDRCVDEHMDLQLKYGEDEESEEEEVEEEEEEEEEVDLWGKAKKKKNKHAQEKPKKASAKASRTQLAEDVLSDAEIFPHFSGLPLPLLYAMEPRVPPQVFAAMLRKHQGAALQEGDSLYIQLYKKLPKPDSAQQVMKTHPEWRRTHADALERAVKGSIVVLPGEALYLPAGWFHEVTSFNLDMFADDEKNAAVAESEKSTTDDESSGEASRRFMTDKGHIAVNYWFHPPPFVNVTTDGEERTLEQVMKMPYTSTFWPSYWATHYAKYDRSAK